MSFKRISLLPIKLYLFDIWIICRKLPPEIYCLRANFLKETRLSDPKIVKYVISLKALHNLLHDMAGGREKCFQKFLFASWEIIPKNNPLRCPSLKNYLLCIHEQEMMYKTTDNLAKSHSKHHYCLYDSVNVKNWLLKM